MFGGFDRDSYNVLGDAVMAPIRGFTNLRWIGFYLAHSATAAGSTWTAKRARVPQVSTWRFLRSEGWGIAPIFLARQFITDAQGHSTANPNWTEANGTLDGNHAVALADSDTVANLVDIERGAVLYLDLEADGFVSVPTAQNYIRGWFNAVSAAGYRPGVYCANPPASVHPAWESDGKRMRALFPDVVVWFIRVPGVQPKVFDEPTGRLTVLGIDNFRDPDGSLPRFGFLASQFAWYNPQRAFTGAKLRTGPTTFHNVAPIDFNASLLPDPAHPEDRAAIAFSAFQPQQPAAFSLEPGAAGWQSHDGDWGQWGQFVCGASDTPITDQGYGRWYDNKSVAAASRRPGLVDIFGLGIDGSVWTAWRSPDAGGVDGTWSPVPQLISASRSARHGSSIAAVSRKLDVLDVFFFNTNHELATTWWSPVDTDWLGHSGAITHGFSFAPASNIEALVTAADPERLDVFAVDWSNVLRWAQWRSPGPWQSTSVPVNGAADPALGVHGAWFAGQLHVLVGMRDGSMIHLSHPDGSLATQWAIRGVLPSLGGLVRPMGFAVAALDSALVVAVVGSNQTLYWSSFEGALWGVPGHSNANPAFSSSGRIAAHRFDANTVDVMLPDQQANLQMRRLVRPALPLAPLNLVGSWEMIL